MVFILSFWKLPCPSNWSRQEPQVISLVWWTSQASFAHFQMYLDSYFKENHSRQDHRLLSCRWSCLISSFSVLIHYFWHLRIHNRSHRLFIHSVLNLCFLQILGKKETSVYLAPLYSAVMPSATITVVVARITIISKPRLGHWCYYFAEWTQLILMNCARFSAIFLCLQAAVLPSAR